ncbi:MULTISPECIES: adenylate/guanylate cyclase domain-containing protein [unclassified Rhizobium]|uniref:adenylate/guanylate cyclase domain-containing protein n=1 Tax=unclassified Rhizobium TaxID=2613769 RepID=UPI001614F5C7|nr:MULTISPECIES: adenylate/guanylate cyclase domain-containing protein [unclassified Rhizobium]MBB3318838.1 class 3 adenylate cyclase/tetratricopeptide (TPR) repeat protein [Rhizobium sp. BK181]MCS3742386.1 class 3 adenylate cyclase/tetratricopeptide (TPR) repeat protein [Rhizobium sp. BK661]MCS4094786.1 class 3 adenylate cyclase/tetratricopeptide (TPR) repeat protein [Rhizobium sp. BK176]
MSDIRRWLADIGLDNLGDQFEHSQIDLESLPLLTERDLREMRIRTGPRRKLLAAIAEMRTPRQTDRRNPVERRQLTILFCDMVGSTEFAAILDPEDFSHMTQQYLARCSALAKSHGGYVANYVGDAFQVLFGYPTAEEDDAERALQLAFDIFASVSQLKSPEGTTLHVRIGIATGLVVVGDIEGAPAGVSTVAFGPVPNLAQRLETLAEPDTILVDQNTYDATARTFAFSDLGTRTLKGFPQPIHVRQPIKALASAYRFSGESRLTRLVGRKTELDRLAAQWRQVMLDKRGNVAAISGEPGIGKSRLVFELQKRLGDTKALIAQCSPAFSNSALYPFLRLLKQETGISDGEAANVTSERLTAFLSLTGVPVHVGYPIFARLLALDQPGSPPSELGSAEQEYTITNAFSGWLQHLCIDGPLLLVVEDEQWIDPSSRRLLQALVNAVASAPILLVVTSRNKPALEVSIPEFQHLKLTRLSRDESGELIESLAEAAGLHLQVASKVLDKAEGVPLFLEELARSTLDDVTEVADHGPDRAEKRVNVPVSLQSALLSRLDKLGRAKTVAQTAAVIGREFDLNTLAHVVGVTAETLRPEIDQLVDVGLVAPQPFSNWPRYTFSHSLLQEAACGALLRDRRRQLHALVAQAIELIEPKTVVEHPEILAQHYDEASLFERAADCWMSAGRKLAATWAKVEAANMFQKGLECVRRMPPSKVRDRKELTLELERGDVLYAAYGYITAEGNAAYRNVMTLSETVGDTAAAINALDGLFGTAFNSARFSDAEWASKQLRGIGSRENNIKALVLGLQFGGMCAFVRGRFPQAREALEVALSYSGSAGQIGSDFPSMAMVYLSWTLHMLGEEDQALEQFLDAEREARGQVDYRVAACLGNGCILMSLRQDTATLQRLVDELIPLATRNGFQLWLKMATFFSGWAKVAASNDSSGIAQMQHICDNMGEQEVDKTCYLGVLADSYLRVGAFAEARSVVQGALTLGERTGEHYYTAELLRLRGELEIKAGRLGDAEGFLRKSIEFAVAQGARVWEARARQSLNILG